MKWAEDYKITGSKDPDVWLNGKLTRNGWKIINLHGEADYLMDE